MEHHVRYQLFSHKTTMSRRRQLLKQCDKAAVARARYNGFSLLHFSAELGIIGLAKLLLGTYRMNPNTEAADGRYPMDMAARGIPDDEHQVGLKRGKLEIIKLLAARGGRFSPQRIARQNCSGAGMEFVPPVRGEGRRFRANTLIEMHWQEVCDEDVYLALIKAGCPIHNLFRDDLKLPASCLFDGLYHPTVRVMAELAKRGFDFNELLYNGPGFGDVNRLWYERGHMGGATRMNPNTRQMEDIPKFAHPLHSMVYKGDLFRLALLAGASPYRDVRSNTLPLIVTDEDRYLLCYLQDPASDWRARYPEEAAILDELIVVPLTALCLRAVYRHQIPHDHLPPLLFTWPGIFVPSSDPPPKRKRGSAGSTTKKRQK